LDYTGYKFNIKFYNYKGGKIELLRINAKMLSGGKAGTTPYANVT